MQDKTKATIGLVLVAAFGTTALAPMAAMASTKGKRNTALGLTAATIYAASKGKGTAALALGAGAAYAWKRTADSKKPKYSYRSYRRGGHTYYYRTSSAGAGPSYNRGLHKGHYIGRRTHGYKKVYYRKNGHLYYRTVRCH